MKVERPLQSTQSAQVTTSGISIGSATIPVWAACVDYFVTKRELWGDVLSAVGALGFRLVSVRVPWNLHELREGEYDFGMVNPELGLRQFLELAHARKLLVSVRPGPRQLDAADLSNSGLPKRVVWDDACLAHTPKGNPLVVPRLLGSHPEPSIHSQKYVAACSAWLKAVSVQLAPLLHPAGPVVLLELGSLGVRGVAERTWGDYRPEAVSAYRAFLRAKYDRPAGLKERHNDPSIDFSNAQPPKPPWVSDTADAACRDWAEFQRRTQSTTLATWAAVAREAGLEDVALSTPADLLSAQPEPTTPRVDTPVGGAEALRIVTTLNMRAEAAGRVGIGRLNAGHSIDSRGSEANELWFQTLRAIAYGLRGFSVATVTPRPGHVGGLLDEHATPTQLGERWASLLEALDRAQFHTLERVVSAQIVLPQSLRDRALSQNSLRPLSASSLGMSEVVTGAELAVGNNADDLHRANTFVQACVTCLTKHRVPFRFVPDDQLDAALSEDCWTLVPSVPELAEELLESVLFAQRRGAPLTLGPQLPPRWPPEPRTDELPAVLSGDAGELDHWVNRLLAIKQLAQHTADPDDVEISFFQNDEGELTLVFVVNPGHRAVTAQLACPGASAKDALDQTRVHSFAERLEIAVPARSVRMLELRVPR